MSKPGQSATVTRSYSDEIDDGLDEMLRVVPPKDYKGTSPSSRAGRGRGTALDADGFPFNISAVVMADMLRLARKAKKANKLKKRATSGSKRIEKVDKYFKVKSDVMKYMLDFKTTSVRDNVKEKERNDNKLKQNALFTELNMDNKILRSQNDNLEVQIWALQRKLGLEIAPAAANTSTEAPPTTTTTTTTVTAAATGAVCSYADPTLNAVYLAMMNRYAGYRHRVADANDHLLARETSTDSDIFLTLMTKVKQLLEENENLNAELGSQKVSELKNELKLAKLALKELKDEPIYSNDTLSDNVARKYQDYFSYKNIQSMYIDYGQHSYIKSDDMEVLRCRSDAMTLQVEASITSRTPAPSHCLNAIERFLDNRFAGGHLTTDDIVGEQLTQSKAENSELKRNNSRGKFTIASINREFSRCSNYIID